MDLELFFGYLDPGTGSIIFQAIVGAVAGVGVFGRRAFGGFSHRIKSAVRRPKDN